jgi:hypothetical protein
MHARVMAALAALLLVLAGGVFLLRGSDKKTDAAPNVQGRVTQVVANGDGSVTLRESNSDGTMRERVVRALPEPLPADVRERVRIIVAHQLGVNIERVTPSTRLSDLSSDLGEVDTTELLFELEEHGRPDVTVSVTDTALFAVTGAHSVSELPALATVDVLIRVVSEAPVVGGAAR